MSKGMPRCALNVMSQNHEHASLHVEVDIYDRVGS